MRPLFFVLGLAFIATVPSNGLKCYYEEPGVPYHTVDCGDQELKDGWARGTYKQCVTANATNGRDKMTLRGCVAGRECDDMKGKRRDLTIYCARCSKDYCNDRNVLVSDEGPPHSATTSAPPVPLLITIVASAISVHRF